MAKDPRNATYRLHLATALFHKGDKAGAKQQLRLALEQKPAPGDEAKIRELLAAIG